MEANYVLFLEHTPKSAVIVTTNHKQLKLKYKVKLHFQIQFLIYTLPILCRVHTHTFSGCSINTARILTLQVARFLQ